MANEESHLVFYDGECGLCDQAVATLLRHDAKEQFFFAPLQGETAHQLLLNLPAELRNRDSVILVENFRDWDRRIYLGSTAVFRIFLLLGGVWTLPGLCFFLPSFLFNWAYRLVAKNRNRFGAQQCLVIPPDQKHRFLP